MFDVCKCVFIYVCVCVCVRVRVCVRTCLMRLSVYLSMCVYVYVHVYVYCTQLQHGAIKKSVYLFQFFRINKYHHKATYYSTRDSHNAHKKEPVKAQR
jgi:hypothetical protein